MVQIKRSLSRRSFLQKTAGVAAGTAALSSAMKSLAAETGAAEAETDDRPIKLGIIGTGSQAMFNLIPAALKVPGAKFTAVCDIVPARVQQAQKVVNSHGSEAKIYDDYTKLLKEADMDAVMIATPLVTHRPIVEEAFKNGHHVFCEKTMAYSIEDCKAMLAAQAKAGKKILQIGHHLRYHPLYYFAKHHYIKAGLCGRINNIHCQWNRNGTWRRPIPKGGEQMDFSKWGFEKPDYLFNWRLYKQYSGGLMTELASHQLDIVNYFLDDKPPQAIMGVGRTDNKDGRTIFDNVHLIYEYPDDVQLTYESITTNSYCPFGTQAYEMFQGTRGTLVMAHLSRYVGLYFLEPGAEEELWMVQAHMLEVGFDNIVPDRHKKAIVLNGTPSPGSRTEKVGGIDLVELVDIEKAQIKKKTYEIELLSFKSCVLDTKLPVCHGGVGLKSAIPALQGNVAMEKKERLVLA